MNKKKFLMLLPLALSGVVGMANSSEISIFPGQAEQEVKFGADIKLTLKRVDEGNTGRIMDPSTNKC
ncbi:hypothetical protein [Thalassotalea sp. ND16A]|uniref:hypothetical protein n=1 Tax=Thalassotalea sp. ND16A TaxID=1535422 RepID=UPI00051D1895|nr:hypothetical protein [Thalassotalea sp. ND16A]KGK00101.1 hypothetical protein ND16A_0292 [Thalassotalea sp. ND16A]